MTNILVHSRATDFHTDAVLWGLDAIGSPSILWCTDGFPESQGLSVHLSNTRVQHVVEQDGRCIDLSSVTAVWNRRHGRLNVSTALDERDRKFAQEQSRHHLAAFLSTACSSALWVNSESVARMDLDKAFQLSAAAEVGFAVPATLLSNSPDRIVDFYEEQQRDLVYKPYKGGVWTDPGGGVAVNYTSRVTSDDLENREALAFAPGIFQRRVEKMFEARVTVVGQAVFAVQIESPHDDWRVRTVSDSRISPLVLPEDVAFKCKAFMRRTGMVFGCFDFIVTPDGEYYFLEVNQMGQFLWKEKHVPELPLLDAMCRFLVSGDPQFTYKPGDFRLSLEDYLASEQHRAFTANLPNRRAAACTESVG